MRTTASPAAAAIVTLALFLAPAFVTVALPEAESAPDASAAAQPARLFVASYGKDSNNGSRLSPKRTFQVAHDAVAADGEIIVVDTAVYGGPLRISKGLSIIAPPGVNGIISVTGDESGFYVGNNTAFIGVILRGLIIESDGQDRNGSGIYSTSGRYVVIDDCTIRNFHDGVLQLTGDIAPPSTTAS